MWIGAPDTDFHPLPGSRFKERKIRFPSNCHEQSSANGRVLIVGASTRAAAWSAARAGLQPVCADLFADLDTQQVAETIRVRDYPGSLPDDVAGVRADGWFFTGGIENHSRLIDRMSRPGASYGSLWGGLPAAIRSLRDPRWVFETLRAASLPCLEVRPAKSPPLPDAGWMQKPVASAGGRAIRVWNHAAAVRDFGEAHYFQRRAEGEPMSAVFRRSDERLEWIGATRQLVNLAMSRASTPYAYCGSIGPIELPASVCRTVTDLAETLSRASGVIGLFGLDFLLDGNRVHLLEVNPRYTASLEVIELARQESLLLPSTARVTKLHPTRRRSAKSTVAKLVLYARDRFTTPDLTHLLRGVSLWEVPFLADIPAPQTPIEAGWPICTVMADGSSLSECESRLWQRAQSIWRIVDGFPCDLSRQGDGPEVAGPAFRTDVSGELA